MFGIKNHSLFAGGDEDKVRMTFRAGGEDSPILKQQQISFARDCFASGATSRVYKGVYTDESGIEHPVAVKEFVLAMTRRMQKKFDKETKLLQTFNHPNVLSFYGRIDGTSSLVTEFLEKRLSVDGEDIPINNVRQLLDELGDNIAWPLRLQIALETAKGVSYLHESECVHCDLKSANVFLGGHDKGDWIVKIGDFGEARVEHKEYLMSQLSSQDPTNNAVGTIPFVAPEVLTGGRPTRPSDIYSFAMLLIELLCPSRTNPWADDCKVPCITSYILEKKRPTLPSEASNISPPVLERFSQLIRTCWNEDPNKRPTIKEVISELQSLIEIIEHEHEEKTEKKGEQLTHDPLEHNCSDEEDSEQDSHPLEIVNLSMHQGSAFEAFGDIAVSFEEAGTPIPSGLRADMEEQAKQHDGSNACTFFATALVHDLEANTSTINLLSNADELKKFVEKVMTDLPKKINAMRDVSSYFSVEEAVDILKAALVCDINIETVMNCFSGVNTVPGEEALLNSLKDLHQRRPAFAVYTCPPISFCIGCCNDADDISNSSTLIIIDTHCIPIAAGGNGNGIVARIKYFPDDIQRAASKLTKWIKRRLFCSNRGGKVQSLTILKKV